MTVKNKTNESGRSMVEMLGVLAIIGVLSITGVAGYKAAVRKSLANNLLNQASMRATDVATQIASGNLDSLGNDAFGGDLGSGITMSSDVTGPDGYTEYKESDEQFTLTMESVDEELCKQMQAMARGSRSIVHKVECVNTPSDELAILTFNKNLSTNKKTENENNNSSGNSGNGGTTESDPACQNVNCPNGLTCYHGECKCNNGTFICGEQCCKEGEYCAQGTDSSTYICVTPTESGGCTKNSDCLKESEYCKFTKGSCTNPGIGTCTPKGELIPYTLEFPTRNLTVYKSSTAMNWWGAVNLCQAHGKQLVTIKDLGISDESGEIVCYYVYSKTADPTLHCICSGDEGCEETAKGLTQIGTSGSLWLADNPPSGSCLAHRVIMNLSAIGYDSLNRDTYYALCR